MLIPLNIAPASGPASGPKSDQITPRKSETSDPANPGKTFESVLAGGAETSDKAEPVRDAAPDQDELSDTDTPEEALDEGEMAGFAGFPDPGAVPEAEPDDEMLVISDDDYAPSESADDPESSTQAGLVAAPGSEAPAARPSTPVEKPVFGPEGVRQGNRPLPSAQAGSARIIAFPPPGGGAASEENTLENEAPRPAGDKTAARTPGAVQSLLNIALNQQAGSAMATQDKAPKPVVSDPQAQPLGVDPALSETATREAVTGEKPTGETAPAGLRTPPAAAQAGLVVPPLSEVRKADRDQPIVTERTKENSRGPDSRGPAQIFAVGSAPTPPVTPVHPATSAATGPISALSDLPDAQQDTGRVTWLSETGVFADTGIAPGATQPSRPSLDQILRNPELPRHLAAQIAQVAGRGGADRPVEIQLNPHELGHVKIKMTSVDGSMNVSVIADRPETLDLMRRHIDVLAQEFLDIGYGQAQFTFGQNNPGSGGDSGHPAPDIPPQKAGHAPQISPVRDTIATTRIITDRVDIRL